MSQHSIERILSEHPVRQSMWIGADAQMFQRVAEVFTLCDYDAPAPDVLDGSGAYVSNIVQQYIGDLTSEQVVALIQYARAHQLDELRQMDALDVDAIEMEVLRWAEPYSGPEVASILGISDSRVYRLARRRGLGRQIGGVWTYTAADIAAMRERPVGKAGQAYYRRLRESRDE